MIKIIKLERHKDQTARGRNGYFDPREITISKEDAGITLAVQSRRAGGSPPLYLSLPAAEMLQVVQAIVEVMEAKDNESK